MAEISTRKRVSAEATKLMDSEKALELIVSMEQKIGIPIIKTIREIILSGKADSISIRKDKMPTICVYIRRIYNNDISISIEKGNLNELKITMSPKDFKEMKP
jgi:hypothetical protein